MWHYYWSGYTLFKFNNIDFIFYLHVSTKSKHFHMKMEISTEYIVLYEI